MDVRSVNGAVLLRTERRVGTEPPGIWAGCSQHIHTHLPPLFPPLFSPRLGVTAHESWKT